MYTIVYKVNWFCRVYNYFIVMRLSQLSSEYFSYFKRHCMFQYILYFDNTVESALKVKMVRCFMNTTLVFFINKTSVNILWHNSRSVS